MSSCRSSPFSFLLQLFSSSLHAYTLVHFVMLGAKVGVFDDELEGSFPTQQNKRRIKTATTEQYFRPIPRGTEGYTRGRAGIDFEAIAWSTLVIGPVLLLLLIQVQFLPYHLEWVTWVQRFAVFMDVVLLWTLWPAVLNGRSRIEWPQIWRYNMFTLLSLVRLAWHSQRRRFREKGSTSGSAIGR